MLVVRIEIWPSGDPSRKQQLGLMGIANVSNLAETSDYTVSASEGANPLTNTPPRNAGAKIVGHTRRQSVYALVAKAAQSIADSFSKEPKP